MEAKTVEKYNRLQSARALGILKVQSFRVFCVPLEKQLFLKSSMGRSTNYIEFRTQGSKRTLTIICYFSK